MSEGVSSDDLLTVAAVAAATGLARSTVRGHLVRGEWPGVRVGRRGVWRVPAAVVAALKAGTDPATLKAKPTGGLA